MNRRNKQKLVLGVILGILYLITAVLRIVLDGEILMGIVNLLTAVLWAAMGRMWYLDLKQEGKQTESAKEDESAK